MSPNRASYTGPPQPGTSPQGTRGSKGQTDGRTQVPGHRPPPSPPEEVREGQGQRRGQGRQDPSWPRQGQGCPGGHREQWRSPEPPSVGDKKPVARALIPLPPPVHSSRALIFHDGGCRHGPHFPPPQPQPQRLPPLRRSPHPQRPAAVAPRGPQLPPAHPCLCGPRPPQLPAPVTRPGSECFLLSPWQLSGPSGEDRVAHPAQQGRGHGPGVGRGGPPCGSRHLCHEANPPVRATPTHQRRCQE